MKLEIDGALVKVTLSRRNLNTLIAKLDGAPSNSARTIFFPGTEDEPTLVVSAEEDADHYGQRGYGPGEMHPATEDILLRNVKNC